MTLDFSNIKETSSSSMGDIIKISDKNGVVLWQRHIAKIEVDDEGFLRFNSETSVDENGILKIDDTPEIYDNGNIGY